MMRRLAWMLASGIMLTAVALHGQSADAKKPARIVLYGFGETDIGYDFDAIDPRYFDRLRITALPKFKDEFGKDGQVYFSVRQTRFGLKSYFPTGLGELFANFEFDLIGAGADAGKTLPRLRHAYGELGHFGAGQYWSPFTDVDAYPTLFESFGPTGLPWVRNIQFRWMIPIRSSNRLTLALENPGASGEGGDYNKLIELENMRLRARTPEGVMSLRHDGKRVHIQVAGIVRRVWWDDLKPDTLELSGHATGWGVNITPVLKFGKKNALRLQYLIGEGVENYVNDGSFDVAPKVNPGDPHRPAVGTALPVQSFTGYLELYKGKWGAIGGFSTQDIENSDAQLPTAFSGGDYATFTLVYYPVQNVLAAAEYQYGRRRNFDDGWRVSDSRLQLTFRVNFSAEITPKPATSALRPGARKPAIMVPDDRTGLVGLSRRRFGG